MIYSKFERIERKFTELISFYLIDVIGSIFYYYVKKMIKMVKRIILSFIFIIFFGLSTTFAARSDIVFRKEYINGDRFDDSTDYLRKFDWTEIKWWIDWIILIWTPFQDPQKVFVAKKNWVVWKVINLDSLWFNIDCLTYELCFSDYSSTSNYNIRYFWNWKVWYKNILNWTQNIFRESDFDFTWKKILFFDYSSWAPRFVVYNSTNKKYTRYIINSNNTVSIVWTELTAPSWYELQYFWNSFWYFFLSNSSSTIKRYSTTSAWIVSAWADLVSTCTPQTVTSTKLQNYNFNWNYFVFSNDLFWKMNVWCFQSTTQNYINNSFNFWTSQYLPTVANTVSSFHRTWITWTWVICIWWINYLTTTNTVESKQYCWVNTSWKLYGQYIPPPPQPSTSWSISSWIVNNMISWAQNMLTGTINRWLQMMFCWVSWTYTWSATVSQLCSAWCWTVDSTRLCEKCVNWWISLNSYWTVLTDCEVELEKSSKSTYDFELQGRAINWEIISYTVEDIEKCKVYNQTETCSDVLKNWNMLIAWYDYVVCTIWNTWDSFTFTLTSLKEIAQVFFYVKKENINIVDSITFRESFKQWMATTFRVVDIIASSVLIWFIILYYFWKTKWQV